MEITGTFKDALSRQAEEAVRIQARKPSESMNSKSQFNHPPIARIVVEPRPASRNMLRCLTNRTNLVLKTDQPTNQQA